MSEKKNGAMPDFFDSARWYAAGINWDARLAREIPVLEDVFGPPGERGLLDAACGPGRQLAAMAKLGYRMTGLDLSPAMLAESEAHLSRCGVASQLVEARFDEVEGAYDGVYCLGNSLAAAGTVEAVEASVTGLAGAVAPGGRLFVQVLNFEKLRNEKPAVRGPRVRRDGDREYVSARVFTFRDRSVELTNVTFWNDGQWRQSSHSGSLYAVAPEEMRRWLGAAGMTIEGQFGNYAREVFDSERSNDYIVVAVKDCVG